jgi:hypothetical protein
MPNVGVVSSVQFTATPLYDAFVAGLQTTGWGLANLVPPKEERGNYGALIQDVRDFNNMEAVTVIAAVGGLPSALAAAAHSTKKPYLVLLGAKTTSLDPNHLLRGGVNLNAPGLNIARNGYLAQRPHLPPIDPNRICLMYDQTNSELTRIELPAWQAHNWPTVNVIINNHVPNFVKAFQDAQHVADAAVVSSDPLFSYQRDSLVQEANNSGMPVCYPFEYDGQGGTMPNPGSMWYGPDLVAAYQSMGVEVGHVLSAPDVARPLIDAPPAGPHVYGSTTKKRR